MRVAACAGAVGALLLCPVAAQARTKVVDVGLPAASQPTFEKAGSDVNDFFPHGVTIHVGDSVAFRPTGEFHTVDLPGRRQGALPFVLPTGQPVAGVTDEAGVPFWFNGFPQLGVNPKLFRSSFGKRVRYSGRRRRESGLSAGATKAMVVKFTRAGSYTYFCDVHAGMKGTVRVRRRGRRIPSAAADRRRVNRQLARDLGIAARLATTQPPAGVVDVGSAGRYGVEALEMFPSALTVSVGTTVRFQLTPRSFEAHTATFGPPSYLNPLSSSIQQPVFDPRAIYSSDPPGTAVLVRKTHGNGFVNTGFMDTSSKSAPPSFNVVRFAQKGTYRFMCLVHPFMRGKITVK